MGGHPEKLSNEELLERIVEHYTKRIRAGERPNIDNYKRKYPRLADEIDDLLSSVAMIEELKQQNGSNTGSLESRIDEALKLTRLGDYRLVRELGRGGMGLVFEAVHESLGRRVALKVLPARAFDDEKSVERFRREAQAAANLHHTNIVGVFGVGQEQGYHYYVMEFIEGCSLGELIQAMRHKYGIAKKIQIDGPTDVVQDTILDTGKRSNSDQDQDSSFSPHTEFDVNEDYKSPVQTRQIPSSKQRPRWAAHLAAQIADALTYAHEQGTLHRDIKPANLLLDRHNTVWLTDFGLVKNLSNHTMTKTGDILGTPQYMAPESFEGEYDERSETYCLGLTLYELVTLHPAFEDSSQAELFRKVISSTPLPPKKRDRQIPSDLNTIIEKAITREPDRRYQSAAKLRDDLQAFLQDRPIQAKRSSLVAQSWRWSRRNPLLATLSVLSMLLMIATAATATTGYLISEEKTRQLAIENTKLEQQKSETEDALDWATFNKNLMEIEKQRAEENVAIFVDAFDELFSQVLARGSGSQFDLDLDGFREMVGIESAIKEEDAELLKLMVGFYQEVASSNSDISNLRIETARGFRRVGNAYHMVHSFEDAIVAYDKSIREYKSLLEEQPRSIEFGLALAQVRTELATAFRNKRDFATAENEYQRAQKGLEEHPQAEASELRFELAKTLNMLAFVWPKQILETRGARAKTRQIAKQQKETTLQAIEILDNLVDREPKNVEFRLVRIKSYRTFAEVQMQSGDTDEGNRSLRLVINECQQLVAEHPENDEYRYLLALAYCTSKGQTLETQLDSFAKSVDISSQLAQKNPQSLDYRQLESIGRLRLAQAQSEAGQKDEARTNVRRASRLLIDTFRDAGGRHEKRMLLQNFAMITRLLNDLGETNALQDLRRELRPFMDRERPDPNFD